MNTGRLKDVDLNLLKVFDAIYAERNVTRAAARMFISQSAASHSLRNLREMFQDQLFVRCSEGVAPTARAELLSGQIRLVLGQMQDLLSLKGAFDPADADVRVTVGLLSPPPAWLLPGLYRVIEEQAPGMSLAFRGITSEQAADVLDHGSMQLVIGVPDSIRDRRRFLFDCLIEDDLRCIVWRSNKLVGPDLDLETYARLPHVAVAQGYFEKTWIDDVLAHSGLERRIRVVVPSPSYLSDLISESDLICTILPNLLIPDHRLRLLRPPFISDAMSIGQFYHIRDGQNPLTAWLRSTVKMICQNHGFNSPV